MNYFRHYVKLIRRAKNRTPSKEHEKHHIINFHHFTFVLLIHARRRSMPMAFIGRLSLLPCLWLCSAMQT